MIAVLSKNKKQAEEFIRDALSFKKNEGKEYYYVGSPDKARGRRFSNIMYAGEYWLHPQFHELEELVKANLL